MKICIVISHPSQFDVPVFRLGKDYIHVVFTDAKMCEDIFDPELKRIVTWEDNIFRDFEYHILNNRKKFFGLLQIFNKNKYDLILTCGYSRIEYIYSIILSKIFAKKNGIRLDTVGYNNLGLKGQFKYYFIQILKVFVNYFFTVGSLSKHFLQKNGIKSNRILFFGYITNTEYFSNNSILNQFQKESLFKSYQLPPSKKIILCISKHIEREAPFDSIKAFSLLNNENLHLVIIGDGELNYKLKSYARDLNILNISFLGYIPFTKLPHFYSIASLFIHDSRDEPWGVSIQEAISCNVPVIASDKVGSAYDLIENGKNGLIYESGNYQELALKISIVLNFKNISIINSNKKILDNWKYESILSDLKKAAFS